MNSAQIAGAVAEFDEIKKGLAAVVDGFGFQNLKITLSLKSGEKWDLVELTVPEGDSVRGIGRHEAEGENPTRWFSVHFDPTEIAWVEFETFKA